MISIIAKIINIAALILQECLLVASFTGKLIVTCVTGISNSVLCIIKSVLLFMQIVYEDNLKIFAEDIPNLINDILVAFGKQCMCVINSSAIIFADTFSELFNIYDSIAAVFNVILKIISEICIMFKSSLLLIGDTVWFLLTFLPIHLPHLLFKSIIYVGRSFMDTILDAYMALLKVTNFMTDVPLESFIGIMSTIIFIRAGVHFRDTILNSLYRIYWMILRKLLYFYYSVYNYLMDNEVRTITHMSTGQEISTLDIDVSVSDEENLNNSDALCVICQERQKCVLILPCRHVCLCTECCRRLYGYQRTCPICRTFIYHSVTVYL